MKKKYQAFGGLFELKFEFSNDSDHVSEFELEDMKREVEYLQKIIDENSLEEKKPKKHKTAKEILGDEEIPYEVRMKYIIDAYRKDQEKWTKLYEYTKHLEKEVIRLKEIMIANGYTDKMEGIEIKSAAQVASKLREKLRKIKQEKKDLETKIKVEFPERKYNLIRYMKVIRIQDGYIKSLQNMLNEKGVPYDPQPPIDALVKEAVDKLEEKSI